MRQPVPGRRRPQHELRRRRERAHRRTERTHPPDRQPGLRSGAARLVAGRPVPHRPVPSPGGRPHRRREQAPEPVHTERREARGPGLVRHPDRRLRGRARLRRRADRGLRAHPDRPLPGPLVQAAARRVRGHDGRHGRHHRPHRERVPRGDGAAQAGRPHDGAAGDRDQGDGEGRHRQAQAALPGPGAVLRALPGTEPGDVAPRHPGRRARGPARRPAPQADEDGGRRRPVPGRDRHRRHRLPLARTVPAGRSAVHARGQAGARHVPARGLARDGQAPGHSDRPVGGADVRGARRGRQHRQPDQDRPERRRRGVGRGGLARGQPGPRAGGGVHPPHPAKRPGADEVPGQAAQGHQGHRTGARDLPAHGGAVRLGQAQAAPPGPARPHRA
ncbi:hypothetical protein SGPA1_70026 [Streptomyces misionensis JCM 4497]